MNLEVKAEKPAARDAIQFQTRLAGAEISAPERTAEVAAVCLEFMNIADWNALKLEFHLKLQELKLTGDGRSQKLKSDLEAKIGALQESIRRQDSKPVTFMTCLSRSTQKKGRFIGWES